MRVVTLVFVLLFISVTLPQIAGADNQAADATNRISLQYVAGSGTPMVKMTRQAAVVTAKRIVLGVEDDVIVVSAGNDAIELSIGEHTITASELELETGLKQVRVDAPNETAKR